jgi:Flp pilus assembly protein TadG
VLADGARRRAVLVDSRDQGTAIIEFVFIAILVLVPLVYLVTAVALVQRSSLAVTNAAREAGRAFATAESDGSGRARAQVAARLALADQGVTDPVDLRYVAAGATCDSAPVVVHLIPGEVFTICVKRSLLLPGVPSVLSGRGVTTEGKYTVHVDDYRSWP